LPDHDGELRVVTDRITLDDPRRAAILAELRGEVPKPDRLNKVAEPTVVDDIRFPSKKEAKRYGELKLLEREGTVTNLMLQVTLPLVVNGVPIYPRGYRADFIYLERQRDQWQSWKFVIEDSKGVRTDVFRTKAQLVKAIYGITIRET
jgi:hypothetical protein